MSYRRFVEVVANCTGDDGCGGLRRKYSPFGLHTRTNPHWKPQVYMCNLFKFLPAFNFFGSFDHLEAHTRQLLEGADLWEAYGADGWGKVRRSPAVQLQRSRSLRVRVRCALCVCLLCFCLCFFVCLFLFLAFCISLKSPPSLLAGAQVA